MKVKSSIILADALKLIESGEQTFACAAILDVETALRWEHKENVTSKAMQVFERFRPKRVVDAMKIYGEWWPKGSPDRIIALNAAIVAAKKQND
jgi:hypothetical protein